MPNGAIKLFALNYRGWIWFKWILKTSIHTQLVISKDVKSVPFQPERVVSVHKTGTKRRRFYPGFNTGPFWKFRPNSSQIPTRTPRFRSVPGSIFRPHQTVESCRRPSLSSSPSSSRSSSSSSEIRQWRVVETSRVPGPPNNLLNLVFIISLIKSTMTRNNTVTGCVIGSFDSSKPSKQIVRVNIILRFRV